MSHYIVRTREPTVILVEADNFWVEHGTLIFFANDQAVRAVSPMLWLSVDILSDEETLEVKARAAEQEAARAIAEAEAVEAAKKILDPSKLDG